MAEKNRREQGKSPHHSRRWLRFFGAFLGFLVIAAIAAYLVLPAPTAHAMGDQPPVGTPLPAPTPEATPEQIPPPATPEPLIPGMAGARRDVAQAREREAAKDHAAAAKLFLRAAEAHPAIADGAWDEAARRQMAAGDFNGAVETLAKLREQHGHRAAAMHAIDRLAKAYDKAGDRTSALTMQLRAASSATTTNRRAFHLVRAAELTHELRKHDAAKALLRQVLEDVGPNRYTIRAMRLYHEWVLPGDLMAQANHAEALGQRVFNDNQFEQSGAALDTTIQLRTRAGQPASPTTQLWRRAGYSLYRTHHNEQAVVYYEKMLAAGVALSAEQLHELGKLYTRLGDAAGAKRAYGMIMRHPSGGFRQTAAYQNAWMSIEEKDYAGAQRYFQKRCRQTKWRNELACWLAGWTAYQNGHRKTALQDFTQAVGGRRFSEKSRYTYWRGRLLLEGGQTAQALGVLQSLNRQQPADYHGILAAELLAKQNAPHVDLKTHMSRNGQGSHALAEPAPGWYLEYDELKDDLGHIIELVDVGLWRAAAAELDRIVWPKKLSPPEDFALAKLCHAARRFDLARTFAYRGGMYNYVKSSNQSLLEAYYPYFMPLGFDSYVRKYAERFKLPPALPFAIILHESGYRAQVVSPAYAVGLMQILPQTGAQIAAALGEPYDEDSLYDPETNIRYGCWYLRHLLDLLGNEPAYAIAGYNAGPKAVGKWLRDKPGQDQTRFVAEVPYQETNRYVRKVLTSMRKYEVLLQSRTSAR